MLSHCIKLIKLVFGSRLASSAAMHLLEFLFILVSSVLDAGCRCAVGGNYYVRYCLITARSIISLCRLYRRAVVI